MASSIEAHPLTIDTLAPAFREGLKKRGGKLTWRAP